MNLSQIVILACIINVAILFILGVSRSLSFGKERSVNQKNYTNEFEIETRANIRFLFFAAALIVPVFAFIGYSSVNGIEESLKKDYNAKVDSVSSRFNDYKDSISSLKDNILVLHSQINGAENSISGIANDLNNVNRNLDKKEEKLAIIEERLELNINNISGNKSKFFIEPVLIHIPEGDIADWRGWDSIYSVSFYQLKTIEGANLPVFKRVPIVSSANPKFDVYIEPTLTGFTYQIYGTNAVLKPGEYDLRFIVDY